MIISIVRVNEIEVDIFGLNASLEPDGMAAVDMMLGEYRKMRPGNGKKSFSLIIQLAIIVC